MQRVFEALASTVRRKILAYLSHTELSAGEIAARFNMSRPSISQHLALLEGAGLVTSEKRGQFVFYALAQDNLINTLNGFVQEVCPVAGPIKRESAALTKAGGKKASRGGASE
jgi:ArsR family transcriptional regulator, arsenate/arsenite/antimonite-responsive transcriptional repressor